MIGEVLTAFVIAAGSALTAVIATAGVSALNKGSYIVAAIFGAMAAAKDYRSLNKMPPVDTSAPPIPTKIPMIILIAGLSASAFLGCTSFYNNMRNAEIVMTHSVTTSYVGWTNTYQMLTNKYKADPVVLAQIEKIRQDLHQGRLEYAASVGVFDNWLTAYGSNTVSETQVQAAWDATMANGSNFIWLYGYYTNQF